MSSRLGCAAWALIAGISSLVLAQVPKGPAPDPFAPAGAKIGPAAMPIPPVAATSAVLLVDPQAAGLPAETGDLLAHRVNTHIALLQSESLIRKAISRPESAIRKTTWFGKSDDPMERVSFIRDHLRVRAVPQTSLIEISLDGITGADRKTILTELCSTHLQNHRQAMADALQDQTATLNSIKIKIDVRLRDISSDLRERAIKLNTDGGAINSSRPTAKEEELRALNAEFVRVWQARSQATTDYENANAAASANKPLPQFDAFINKDERYRDLRRLADDIELRLIVAKRHEDKAAIADAEAQLKWAHEKLESWKKEMRETWMQALRARAESAQTAFAGLLQRIDNLKAELAEVTIAMGQFVRLQEEEHTLRAQRNIVADRIDKIMTQVSSKNSDIIWQQMPEPDTFR